MARKRVVPSPIEIVRKLQACNRSRSKGVSVGDLIKRLKVSESTYYRWSKDFGGVTIDQAKSLSRANNADSRIKELTRKAAEASKNVTQRGREILRLRRRIKEFDKQLQRRSCDYDTTLMSVFIENRSLRDLERSILFFVVRFTQGAIPLSRFLRDLQGEASAEDLDRLYKLAFDVKTIPSAACLHSHTFPCTVSRRQ